MATSISRDVVETFYKICADRDVVRIAEFLDDNVVWTIKGPAAHLPYCSTRAGKAAVIDLIQTLAPELFQIRSFVRETLVVDGDCAATLNKLTATRRDRGHSISYASRSSCAFAPASWPNIIRSSTATTRSSR